MIGEETGTGKAIYKRMWCNTYRCARCGPKRYRRARGAIREAATKLKLSKFWTLTLDPKKLDRSLDCRGQIKFVRECWRKLRVYLQRRFGRAVPFICVLELQQSGLPHLHVLLAEWIPQSWMRESWEAVGGGQMVWVEPVSIRRVAAYLAKYITKERLDDLPVSARRFSASKSIVLFGRIQKEPNWRWFAVRSTIDTLRTLMIAVANEKFLATEGTEPVLVSFETLRLHDDPLRFSAEEEAASC